MQVSAFNVRVGRQEVSAELALADGEIIKNNMVVLLAHGADPQGMNRPFLVSMTDLLSRRGFPALRFNFLFAERGKKNIDEKNDLLKVYSSVINSVRAKRPSHLILSGFSLGAVIAARMAKRYPCDGLVFFGWPMTTKKREPVPSRVLFDINIPMLFISGTEDAYTNARDLTILVSKLKAKGKRAELFFVDGVNHGFEVSPNASISQLAVHLEIVEMIDRWIAHYWY